MSRTAYDVKDAHRLLEGITDDGLNQIPVLAEGVRLEQNATYIDLRDPHWREFTATGEMIAGRENWYVPKDSVDYELWNRLIGIPNKHGYGQRAWDGGLTHSGLVLGG